MSQLVKVELTHEECLLLDGRVNEAAQKIVDVSKRRLEAAERLSTLTAPQAAFIADLVAIAESDGRLLLGRVGMRSCKACGKAAGYAKYKRDGRYHRKGQSDHSKPLEIWGYGFTQDFVTMRGYPRHACCPECWDAMKPIVAAELRNVRAVVPAEISGEPPRFKRYDNMKCSLCGWEGHEGEMGRRAVVIGNGTYPSDCPKCDAKNVLFQTQINRRDGFTLVEIPTA